MLMSHQELLEAAQNPKTAVIEVSICAILAKTMKSGDHSGLSWLTERMFGKIPTTDPADEALKDVSTDIKQLGKEELIHAMEYQLAQLKGEVLPVADSPGDEGAE